MGEQAAAHAVLCSSRELRRLTRLRKRMHVLTAFCSPLSLLAAKDFWKLAACWQAMISLQEMTKSI